jgi:hypothetical protein
LKTLKKYYRGFAEGWIKQPPDLGQEKKVAVVVLGPLVSCSTTTKSREPYRYRFFEETMR